MAQFQTAGVSPPRPNTIQNAVEDFDAVIQRAAEYAGRLQKLVDRVHGPSPQEVGGGIKGDGSIPHSLIASIHQRRSALVAVVDEIEGAVQRLESGL